MVYFILYDLKNAFFQPMKQSYTIIFSLVAPVLVFVVFEWQLPSIWRAIPLAGFLLGLTVNTEKILSYFKTSIVSLVIFSTIFGVMLPIFNPDSHSTPFKTFVVFFAIAIIFGAIGNIAGFLSKSLYVKIHEIA